jgi:hypothetical protein
MNILDGKITFDKDSTVFCKSCSIRPVITISIAAPDNIVSFRLKATGGTPATKIFRCVLAPGDYQVSELGGVLETALNVGTGLETAIESKSINYYYASWRVRNVLDKNNIIIGFQVQNYTSVDPYDVINTSPGSMINCVVAAGVSFPALSKSAMTDAWDSVWVSPDILSRGAGFFMLLPVVGRVGWCMGLTPIGGTRVFDPDAVGSDNMFRFGRDRGGDFYIMQPASDVRVMLGPGAVQAGDYIRLRREKNTIIYEVVYQLSDYRNIQEKVRPGSQAFVLPPGVALTESLYPFVCFYSRNAAVAECQYVQDVATNGVWPASGSLDGGVGVPTASYRAITFGSVGPIYGFPSTELQIQKSNYPTWGSALGIVNTGEHPSYIINIPNLPIASYNFYNGRKQPTVAVIPKLEQAAGSLQVYTDYAPVELKCMFQSPTSVSKLEVEILNIDGTPADLLGVSEVVLVFKNIH